MKKTCKSCGQQYQYRHSNYCCSQCFWTAVNKFQDNAHQSLYRKIITFEEKLQKHVCYADNNQTTFTSLKQEINMIRNQFADIHENEIYLPNNQEVTQQCLTM